MWQAPAELSVSATRSIWQALAQSTQKLLSNKVLGLQFDPWCWYPLEDDIIIGAPVIGLLEILVIDRRIIKPAQTDAGLVENCLWRLSKASAGGQY